MGIHNSIKKKHFSFVFFRQKFVYCYMFNGLIHKKINIMIVYKSNCCEEDINIFDVCEKCGEDNGIHSVDEPDSLNTELLEDIDKF